MTRPGPGAVHRWLRMLHGLAGSPSLVGACAAVVRRTLWERMARARVAAQYGLPQGLATIELLDLCPGLDEVVGPFAGLEGGSPALDVALLRVLFHSFDRARYFEIGSWRGESLASVAAVAGDCVSLSLGREEAVRMLAGELDGGPAQAAAMGEELHRFTRGLLAGDSRRFDFAPCAGSCDVVFVDGSHEYDVVRSDTRNAFRLLCNSDSVIVWHDYGATQETVRWPVLLAILDDCPDESTRSRLRHVTNTLCAVFTGRSLPPGPPTLCAAAPRVSFRMRVTAEPATEPQVEAASAERSTLPFGRSGSRDTSTNRQGTR